MEGDNNIKNRELLDSILEKKEKLAFLPTPLHKLSNLTTFLQGPNIYIKRDDMTGLALGGNKTRKLEYIVYEALQNKCDTIITIGAPQSNHCRQTAAACTVYNLDCYLFLVGHSAELADEGNILLDKLMNAKIKTFGTMDEALEGVEKLQNELKIQGKKAYYCPPGGSFCPGINGYISAFKEIMEDEKKMNIQFDYIFFCSSSFGTHCGLQIGHSIYGRPEQKIYGISNCKAFLSDNGAKTSEEIILEMINKYCQTYKVEINIDIKDIILDQRFNEAGYAVLSSEDRKAIEMFATKEGILLDPVYSGRAAGGLLKMIENQEIPTNKNVLFIHTGGVPALFTGLFILN